MSLKNCLLDIEDQIAVVTINREKALNALNKDVISDLDYLFNDRLKTEILRGIIITGAGEKAFVAGADITEFNSLDKETGAALSRKGRVVFQVIEDMSVPVIGAINGFALGGGCELAMACHMRLASPNAKFGQPEVKLGLLPGYGGTQRLTRYIGKPKSMELSLTGQMIDAEEALSLGLINHVIESGDVVTAAKDLLNKIKKVSPFAVSQIIKAINAYYDHDSPYEFESSLFGECLAHEESTEGVSAFLEKRKPNFG